MKTAFENYNKEKMARVLGRDVSISPKHALEVCNFIKGKELDKARQILNKVIEKKIAVPYKRYNMHLAHKPGKIGPGRYPINTCKEIIKLLDSVEANAQDKGLTIQNLIIKQIIVNRAARPWHFGRKTRVKMKRANVEILVEEKEKPKETKK